MKIKSYGSRISLYKSNQIWREARAKHNRRDSQIHETMNRAIFTSMSNFTYGQNSLIIKQAALRVLKSI
jgi:hypothetical protein